MPTFLTGQRLTADLLNSYLTDYQPLTYSKGGVTSRTSTTTLTDDPELTGIPLAVGTYDIELVGFWTQAATTPSLKTQWAFTGTWNTPTRACQGLGIGSTTAPDLGTIAHSRGNTTAQNAIYGTYASTAYTIFRERAVSVIVTVAGSLSLQWAQNTSIASAVNLQGGTSFIIRKA